MLRVIINQTGNVAVLTLQGRIVRGETDSLRTAVFSHPSASVMVIDLARVNTIDAGGLGIMLELREFAESRGIEFRLRNVTKLVRRILEITRLDSVFKVTYENESRVIPAVAMFGSRMQTTGCARS